MTRRSETFAVVLFLWTSAATAQPSSPPAAQPSSQPAVQAAQHDRVAHLIARGEAARAAGNTISALGYFRDAISAAPRRSEGYVALGHLYLKLQEPLRALEVFETGSRSAEGTEALFLGYAETLNKLGQREQALRALRQLRDLHPSVAGLAALAEAAEARGSFVEALAVRRALVDMLGEGEVSGDEPARVLNAQRAQVRALEVLLGGADRIRNRTICTDPAAGDVARALARCH